MKKIFLILSLYISLFSFSQDNKYLPLTAKGVIVTHNYHILSYVEEYEGSEWVAYELTYPETKNNVDRREGEFFDDDSVKSGSALHKDYTNTGYDRGHLAPAGDMNFDLQAMLESFNMSNVLPQTPELNRKTWKYMEDDIRYYVMNHKTPLYIITGGIFSTNPKFIGVKNKVAVPEYFYKIIYDDTNKKMMTIVIPNDENPDKDFFYYVTSVTWVEFYTGIKFFPNMDDKFEIEYESKVSAINWLTNKK
jgi:endonuclease G